MAASWDGDSAAAGPELAGWPGRGTGAGRQVGPSLGLGQVRGGDAGPDEVRAGARSKLPGNVGRAVRSNSALGAGKPCFLPRPAKSGEFYSKTQGEAGRTERKGEGTGRTRLDGDQRGTNPPVGSTRARCVDVAVPVLDVLLLMVILGLNDTK